METAAGKAPPGANVTFSSRCARPAKGDRGHLAPVSARFGEVGGGDRGGQTETERTVPGARAEPGQPGRSAQR